MVERVMTSGLRDGTARFSTQEPETKEVEGTDMVQTSLGYGAKLFENRNINKKLNNGLEIQLTW